MVLLLVKMLMLESGHHGDKDVNGKNIIGLKGNIKNNNKSYDNND